MTYRKLTSAELTNLGGAFAAGYDAERAKQLFAPELSFSPKSDLSLALGWPLLLELEPPSKVVDPVKDVVARLAVATPARSWPVDLATRAVRLLAVGYADLPDQPEQDALVAAANDDPFDPEELKPLLSSYFEVPQPAWHQATWFLGALEALGGTEALLGGMLDLLEEGGQWNEGVNPMQTSLVKRLAYVLRRLKSTDAKSYRRRGLDLLAASIEELPTLLKEDKYSNVPYRGLALFSDDEEMVRAGAARVGGKLAMHDAVFLPRPAVVAALRERGKPEEGELPTAQWVVAGGPEVLDIELGRWDGYGVKMDKAAAHAYVLDQYGVFRTDGAVALIADMAARSAVKKDAQAWLEAHRDVAEPALAKIAKSSSPAKASAEQALKGIAKKKPS